jgi:glucokinase
MGGWRSGRDLLVADIGGTKTTFAIYDSSDIRAPRATRTVDSRAARDLDSILDDFLAGGPPPGSACLAVAGPVVDGAVRVTNLPWVVSARDLAERYAFARVDLLNDVEALGWATKVLRTEDLVTLQEGRADPAGPVAILSLGTGLGQGYATGAPNARDVHASEGGHADLAPATPVHTRLLADLQREFGHVSVERACSGTGLPRIHRFLLSEGALHEEPSVAREVAAAADPTPIIVREALRDTSAACRESVALLCDLLAAEAGNLALKVLSTGGVFLGGGLAPRLLPFLKAARFRDAFLAKGRLSPLLAAMPLRVILSPDAVLWGAALRGMLHEGPCESALGRVDRGAWAEPEERP